MESLFQRFSEDRRLRQADRSAQIKSMVQSKQQRQKELRSQAESLNQLLTSAHQERLLNNRNRQIVANLHQKSRSADSCSRTQAVANQLTQQRNLRQANAQADRQSRHQEFSQRASELQQFLSHLYSQRLADSLANQQLRQRDRLALLHDLQMRLRQVRIHRLHSSDLAKFLRQQQQSALADNTKQLLAKLKSDRLSQATSLRHSLSTFRRQLAEQVGTITQAPTPSPKALAPAKPKAPEPQKPVSIPVTNPEQFIAQYLAKLPNQPSLAQVISDRDLVRDILAQGATQLKVDPSEILSTLLRMASTA